MTLLERVREAKRSPAVLRLGMISLIGRFPDKKILIFEGEDDVGVYQEWIRRYRDEEWFRPLPGRGKKQLLELLRELKRENSEFLSKVLFFVDLDYDGVSADEQCPQLFVTDRYSIENYLCDRRVIDEVLVDELRCARDVCDLDAGLLAFDQFFSELVEAILEPCAIYRAGVIQGLRLVQKPEKLNGGLEIGLRSVRSIGTWVELVQFGEAPDAELVATSLDFVRNGGGSLHRGKWLLAAVRAWIRLLYADRRADTPDVFGAKQASLGASPDQLGLRSLASRSSVPLGFGDFVRAA